MEPSPVQKAASSASRLTPQVVLCVDDEVVGLKVRKILLERAGYKVLGAMEGTEGIEIFAKERVDAVVLDYAMPGLNGAEVATRMREINPNVPILLLSAYLGLPREVTSLVDVYMTKGEGAPMLLKKLRTMLAVTQMPGRPAQIAETI